MDRIVDIRSLGGIQDTDETADAAMMTEKQLVNLILEYLNFNGHFSWRHNTGAIVAEYKGKKRFWRAGLKGSSDIIGIAKDGKFIAIEAKGENGHPTREQKDFLSEIERRGGYACVAWDLKDVQIMKL